MVPVGLVSCEGPLCFQNSDLNMLCAPEERTVLSSHGKGQKGKKGSAVSFQPIHKGLYNPLMRTQPFSTVCSLHEPPTLNTATSRIMSQHEFLRGQSHATV